MDIDLRPGGVRVGIPGPGTDRSTIAGAVSLAAHELGLPAAAPSALHLLRLTFRAREPDTAAQFWRPVLGYEAVGDGLADPQRRDPTIRIEQREPPSPLRDRVHLDVVRPPGAVAAIRATVGQTASGPYGVMLADPDGNEVDRAPGDDLSGGPETSDWRVVFSAMARYRADSRVAAAEFAGAVAQLADDAGTSLLVDLRGGSITVDSGKDRWEGVFEPAGTTFAHLAGEVQAAARARGLVSDPDGLRFLQIGIDAADVPAAQEFWTTVLGYERDPRPDLSRTSTTPAGSPRW